MFECCAGDEKMFWGRDALKSCIEEIITCNNDNNIVFIVGHKGVGKTRILDETKKQRVNSSVIVADGKRVKTNSILMVNKCYIEGIYEFLIRHNTRKNREALCDAVKQVNSTVIVHQHFKSRRSLTLDSIILILQEFTTNELKGLYALIAGQYPLVVILNVMNLSEGELKYIESVNDEWDARVTFLLSVRPNKDQILFVKKVLKNQEGRVVQVLPMLPQIKRHGDSSHPLSLATIELQDVELQDVGLSSDVTFEAKAIENNDIYDLYDKTRKLTKIDVGADMLFLLANQEITLSELIYLHKLNQEFKKKDIAVDENISVIYKNTVICADALIYYWMLHEPTTPVIPALQEFFFHL